MAMVIDNFVAFRVAGTSVQSHEKKASRSGQRSSWPHL